MARPLRILYPGAFYHVTARGNERRKVFLSAPDYGKFLSYLSDALHKYSVILHAFVLMANHYHLLMETPKANLGIFMHALNSGYATFFNLKRKRAGHLFQGRYKALLIDADTYLLELSRYIHLNPVRAGIVVKPESYPYSSYRAYTFPKEETIVFRDLLWGMISGERKRSPQRYCEFVESALAKKIRNPFEKVYGGVILGGRTFIKEALQRVQDQGLEKEETSHRRSLVSGGLDIDGVVDFLCGHLRVPREEVISSAPYRGYAVYLSRKHTACPNKEIGRYFGGISYSAVTKIGTRLKERMRQDQRLGSEIWEMDKKLSRVKG